MGKKKPETIAREKTTIAIRDAVAVALGTRSDSFSVDVGEWTSDVAFHYSVTMTYDDVLDLSLRLGTRTIDFEYTSGWGGTEVTPGDDSALKIKLGTGYRNHAAGIAVLGEPFPKSKRGRKS